MTEPSGTGAPHGRIAATLLVFALAGPPIGATVTFLGFEVLATGRIHTGSVILFGVYMTTGVLPALVFVLGLVPALLTGAAAVLVALGRGRRAALAASPLAGAIASVPVIPVFAGPSGLTPGPIAVFLGVGVVSGFACAVLAMPVLPRRTPRPSPPAADPC